MTVPAFSTRATPRRLINLTDGKSFGQIVNMIVHPTLHDSLLCQFRDGTVFVFDPKQQRVVKQSQAIQRPVKSIYEPDPSVLSLTTSRDSVQTQAHLPHGAFFHHGKHYCCSSGVDFHLTIVDMTPTRPVRRQQVETEIKAWDSVTNRIRFTAPIIPDTFDTSTITKIRLTIGGQVFRIQGIDKTRCVLQLKEPLEFEQDPLTSRIEIQFSYRLGEQKIVQQRSSERLSRLSVGMKSVVTAIEVNPVVDLVVVATDDGQLTVLE